LFNRYAIVESGDRDVFLTVPGGIIDEGDDGGVKFVLNRKHGCQGDGIGGSSQGQVLERGGVFAIVARR
jgi:hypothetical protein